MAEGKTVARQGLAVNDGAYIEGKALQGHQRAGFVMEMGNIEAPATGLMAAMLAHNTI